MPKSGLTPAQEMAEILHNRICQYDIGGACSWKHVKNPWSDPKYFKDDDWPFKGYLDRARRLLKACNGSFDQANKMIIAIFGH